MQPTHGLYGQWEREASHSIRALAFFLKRSARLSLASLRLGFWLSGQIIALLFRPPSLVRRHSIERPGQLIAGALVNQSWTREDASIVERLHFEQKG
jgi:hypothetical protein